MTRQGQSLYRIIVGMICQALTAWKQLKLLPRGFQCGRSVASVLSLLVVFSELATLPAAPLPTPGNILVTDNQHLYEYGQYGGVGVRSVAIPQPQAYTVGERARDLVVDANGIIYVYNGTFSPYLSIYDPVTETWSHRTHPGWSTVANVSYGGIAVTGGYAFVTDMSTYGGMENGIIRFNLANLAANTSLRFADGYDFIDLTIGWDGLLYGLRTTGGSEGTTIEVYHPVTLAHIRSVNQGVGLLAIAVAANGDIFGAALDGKIYHFDSNGVLLAAMPTGANNLFDIDLSAVGQIVCNNWFDQIVFWDVTFGVERIVNRGCEFVAFVQSPPQPAPHDGFLTANAGPDQGVTVSNGSLATVTLDGTGSSDPQNDVLTFNWSGSFGTATGPTPTITLGIGVHTITLTVDDGNGNSAIDTVVVTVVEAPPPTVNLWHISRGTVVTATSGIHSGFSAADIFGGTASTLEPGQTVFSDGKPAGFTHYIEWRTSTPVTLGEFALYAVGDSPTYNNQREFARFVLKAKSAGSATFDLVLYDYTPTHPYTFLDAASRLLLADNIPSVTAQEFRAEFVQFTAGRGYDGPRIIELEGFAPQNQPPVANAGSDQAASVGDNCQASVTLDGTGSSDPDNDALTFTWTGSFGTATGATPTVTLGTGVHTVTLTVDDGKGGSASDTVLVTVVDATPPTVIAPPGTTTSADANGQALIPNVLAGAGAIDNCTPTGNLNLTQSPLPGTAVGLGMHTITVYASDSAGNQGMATTTFTVNDTTPPTVTAPAGTIASAGANGLAAIPDVLAGVVAADNCTPVDQLAKSQIPAAGTLVGLGTHTITIGVADAAGNMATATTTFTVVDTTAPVIQSLTASPSTLSATGKLVLVKLSASVTDNTDPAPRTRIISVTANEPLKAPGAGVKNPDYQITGDLTLYLRAKSSTKAGRVYTITVESKDVAGNRSTATVNVKVATRR